MNDPHPRLFALRKVGRKGIVLVGLCLLAFGLRVARLDFHPIWFDEDLAYQRATATLAVSLASMAGSPLYYILLRGRVQVAGASLFALRYFSMLWGTVTIPLIYQVTRRWLGDQIALATAIIAVFAPFYVCHGGSQGLSTGGDQAVTKITALLRDWGTGCYPYSGLFAIL